MTPPVGPIKSTVYPLVAYLPGDIAYPEVLALRMRWRTGVGGLIREAYVKTEQPPPPRVTLALFMELVRQGRLGVAVGQHEDGTLELLPVPRESIFQLIEPPAEAAPASPIVGPAA